MKDLGYHKGYQYAHNDAESVVTHEHLPEKLVGKKFYEPVNKGHEQTIKDRLEKMAIWRKKKRQNVSRGTNHE